MLGSYTTSACSSVRETEALSTPVVTDNAFWTAVEHDEQCMPVTLNLVTCTVPATTHQPNVLLLFIAGVPLAVKIVVLRSSGDPTYTQAFDCVTSIKE